MKLAEEKESGFNAVYLTAEYSLAGKMQLFGGKSRWQKKTMCTQNRETHGLKVLKRITSGKIRN